MHLGTIRGIFAVRSDAQCYPSGGGHTTQRRIIFDHSLEYARIYLFEISTVQRCGRVLVKLVKFKNGIVFSHPNLATGPEKTKLLPRARRPVQNGGDSRNHRH